MLPSSSPNTADASQPAGPAGPFDPLACYGAWLGLWRASFLDLPLVMAWEGDVLARRGLSRGAERLAALGEAPQGQAADAALFSPSLAEAAMRDLAEGADAVARAARLAFEGALAPAEPSGDRR
jgi:hypothetical protein